ncbi:hypothetical protein [Thiolapillus sp.]|uniref:hypothetical protein n=2 Tax=Thiolapillus sp. TaxID=2017437 RepID=UPI003AF9FF6F
MSLPRDRFWDIQVSKIDSPTRQPLLPRPSCVRAASPHLRKLGAGYAALPQMTGRDFSYAYFVSPLRYRTPDKQCGPGRYRGLTAFASLSMAVSVGYPPRPWKPFAASAANSHIRPVAHLLQPLHVCMQLSVARGSRQSRL